MQVDIIKLFHELRKFQSAVKLDKKLLKQFDPSFEIWYQYLFHAGFKSLRLYRLSHAFYLSGFKFVAYFLYNLNRVLYSVDIHPAAKLEPGIVIDHGTGLVIGSTTEVGSGTIIYHGVTLGAKEIKKGKRHPTIGRNVVLGAGAKVIGPITIGDGAGIGANSVVLKDIPPYSTVVGIPGRIVKYAKEKENKNFNSVNNENNLKTNIADINSTSHQRVTTFIDSKTN
ncbi:MAG: serine O-acetyltransferase EpsC [Fervidobacterium sp.]